MVARTLPFTCDKIHEEVLSAWQCSAKLGACDWQLSSAPRSACTWFPNTVSLPPPSLSLSLSLSLPLFLSAPVSHLSRSPPQVALFLPSPLALREGAIVTQEG